MCVGDAGPTCVVALSGAWTLANAEVIDRHVRAALRYAARQAKDRPMMIDCSGIDTLDTTGAVLIRRFAASLEEKAPAVVTGIAARHKRLLEVINCRQPAVAIAPDMPPWHLRLLEDVGVASVRLAKETASLLSFIGNVLVRFVGLFLHPTRLRVTALVHQIDVVGVRAMGIVGLISFLIGAVMVNQGAVQLAKFGADIFVIDMLGISHLRELGILLTAIIVAGRSGSAFTAEIGSMQLHEEIDAMKTIGMNPIDVLVLPRLMALMLALPLLGFYADMVGIAGGSLMAWVQLGISPANFFVYFREVISIDHFIVGLVKAPFFAAVIVVSGCYQGLTVAGSSDSLGRHTTRAVVESIFLVIVLDALFSIFFTAIDL